MYYPKSVNGFSQSELVFSSSSAALSHYVYRFRPPQHSFPSITFSEVSIYHRILYIGFLFQGRYSFRSYVCGLPFQYSFWPPVFWHSLDMTIVLCSLFFCYWVFVSIRFHFNSALIFSFLEGRLLIKSNSTVLTLFRIIVVTG